MLCSTCYVTMTEEQTYDYSADVEQFLVKSWRCGRCEGMIEEIVVGPS
jgi:ferredoxin